MKGFTIFGAVVLAILAFLVAEFFYLQAGIRDSAIVRRTFTDIKIIEDINKMEFLKRSQKTSLEFSFHKTYEFLGKRGGFSDLSQIPSYDCIPYWQNYTTKNLPDIKQNMEKTSASFFGVYMNVFRDAAMTIPSYEILIEDVQPPYPSTLNIQAKSSDNIELNFEKVNIIEKSNFNYQVPIGLFQEYQVAKENFIDTDIIKKTVDDSINDVINSNGLLSTGSKTDCGCPSEDAVFTEANKISFTDAKNLIRNNIINKISELQQNVNDKLIGTDIEIKIEPDVISEITPHCVDTLGDSCGDDKNLCTRTCNFDFTGFSNVMITVENKNVKYLIGNELKTAPLKFRIIDGSLTIIPSTNGCTENI